MKRTLWILIAIVGIGIAIGTADGSSNELGHRSLGIAMAFAGALRGGLTEDPEDERKRKRREKKQDHDPYPDIDE